MRSSRIPKKILPSLRPASLPPPTGVLCYAPVGKRPNLAKLWKSYAAHTGIARGLRSTSRSQPTRRRRSAGRMIAALLFGPAARRVIRHNLCDAKARQSLRRALGRREMRIHGQFSHKDLEQLVLFLISSTHGTYVNDRGWRLVHGNEVEPCDSSQEFGLSTS
jgi:hypothetical protein